MNTKKSKICYVTAFLDLDRKNWKSYSRSWEKYLNDFMPYLYLFENNDTTNYEMIIYIDEKFYLEILKLVKKELPIKIVKINRKYLKDISIPWNRLEKEEEIMKSAKFKNMLKHRLEHPEVCKAEYTLINHAKIDFVVDSMRISNAEYFCWTDFGYFSKHYNIPSKLLDFNKLNLEKVNYTTINSFKLEYTNLFYVLCKAPDFIGGFFFFGNKKVLKEYQKLYHKIHLELQEQNIVDDDQHLALLCYLKNPNLFELRNLNGWHKALLHFQLK